MSKIELSILTILGLILVWMDYPLWLGICVAAPAIFLTPEGGEKDGNRQRTSSKRKRRNRSNAA